MKDEKGRKIKIVGRGRLEGRTIDNMQELVDELNTLTSENDRLRKENEFLKTKIVELKETHPLNYRVRRDKNDKNL